MIRNKAQNRSTLKREYVSSLKGKSAIYNEAILMTLLKQGPMKEWALSKAIAENAEFNVNSDEHNVYSILIRKKGRLNDLESKGYIKHNEEKGTYGLELKGLFIMLSLNPELNRQISQVYLQDLDETILQNVGEFIENNISNKRIKKADLLKFLKNTFSKSGFLEISECFTELINSGLDPDRIKEDFLLTTLYSLYAQRKAAIESLNK